jgi:hypothetical protein
MVRINYFQGSEEKRREAEEKALGMEESFLDAFDAVSPV